jgi:hypothetical protein
MAEREEFAQLPPKPAEMLGFLPLSDRQFVPPCWTTDKTPNDLARSSVVRSFR